MLLRAVPSSPAYLVCHDCFDNGAMDVWPHINFTEAQSLADLKNNALDARGIDSCFWRAYEKLPRKKVFKYHTETLPLR